MDKGLPQMPRASRRLPILGILAGWYGRHPFVTMWGALALGMAVVVVLFGQDVGLTFRQHTLLTLLTVPLAWLCTWIVSLEHGAERGTPDGAD